MNVKMRASSGGHYAEATSRQPAARVVAFPDGKSSIELRALHLKSGKPPGQLTIHQLLIEQGQTLTH